MIQVTLTCSSVQELHQVMRQLIGQADVQISHAPVTLPPISQGQVAAVLESATQPDESMQTPHNYAEPAPAANGAADVKPKRTRRTKAEIEAEKQARAESTAKVDPDMEPAPAEAAPTKAAHPSTDGQLKTDGAITKEMVHQALQQVNVAVNLNKAREIISKFKINRISELKPEQYKDFVDACNEAVMLEG